MSVPTKTKHKCECPGVAIQNDFADMIGYTEEEKPYRYHEKGNCKNPKTKQYLRQGKKLWLCSCCNLIGDEEVI